MTTRRHALFLLPAATLAQSSAPFADAAARVPRWEALYGARSNDLIAFFISAFATVQDALLDMARDDYARRETRDEARRLMRWLIGARLGGQSLHTREVLQELQEL